MVRPRLRVGRRKQHRPRDASVRPSSAHDWVADNAGDNILPNGVLAAAQVLSRMNRIASLNVICCRGPDGAVCPIPHTTPLRLMRALAEATSCRRPANAAWAFFVTMQFTIQQCSFGNSHCSCRVRNRTHRRCPILPNCECWTENEGGDENSSEQQIIAPSGKGPSSRNTGNASSSLLVRHSHERWTRGS